MNIRTRLTLWYTAVLALIVVAIGVFLVWRLRTDLMHGLDSSLESRARQITNVVEDPLESREPPDLAEVTSGNLDAGNNDGIQIAEPSGRVLASWGVEGGSVLLMPAATARAATAEESVIATSTHHGAEFRVVALRLPRSGDLVLVASPTLPVTEAGRRLVALLAIAIPGSIVLSALGGYVLARRALRPIDRMTQAADAIGVDDTTARLDVPATQDEVARLGRTLNRMLDRLHEAMAEQRRFTADASHELRTPLSIMQSEVDVALRSPRTPDEARPALESINDELSRMRRIVENLLTLARMDEGRLELAVTEVDLVDVARTAGDRFESPARTKGVTLTVDGATREVMWGDRTRLEQLVTNLIDNAVKYTGAGGSVRVTVGSNGDGLRLQVADTGVGIPTDAMPHVFDRFYRADKARTRAAGGSGLGLAICRSIVEAHHGEIDVKSEAGEGSVFTVLLPKRP